MSDQDFNIDLKGKFSLKQSGNDLVLRMMLEPTPIDPEPPVTKLDRTFSGRHSVRSGSYGCFSSGEDYIALDIGDREWVLKSVTGNTQIPVYSDRGSVMSDFMWADYDNRHWILNGQDQLELRDLTGEVIRSYRLPLLDKPGFHWRSGTGSNNKVQFVIGWWEDLDQKGHYRIQFFDDGGLLDWFDVEDLLQDATRFHNVLSRDSHGVAGPLSYPDERQRQHHLVSLRGFHEGLLENHDSDRFSHPCWNKNRCAFFNNTTGQLDIEIRNYDEDEYVLAKRIPQEQLRQLLGLSTYVAGGHLDYRGEDLVASVRDFHALGLDQKWSLVHWSRNTDELKILASMERFPVTGSDQPYPIQTNLLPSISPKGKYVAFRENDHTRVVSV